MPPDMREAARWDNRLFDRLSDVLDGFKEVRLNRARSDALFDHVVEVSRTAANIKIRTQSETYRRMVLLQTSLYILLGSVAFVVPLFSMPPGSDHQGRDRAGVHRRRLLRPRADRSRSSPRRTRPPTGSRNWRSSSRGSPACRMKSRPSRAKKFTKIEMRDVEFHYPGKIGGDDVQGRAVQFHAQRRRPRHSDRRQWVGQIDVHEDPRRLLPAGVRRACCSTARPWSASDTNITAA